MKKFLKYAGYLLAGLALAVVIGPLLIPLPPLEGIKPLDQLKDPDSRFIRVQGVDLHYKDMGQGETTIILLHGFGASTYSWREVMAPLSKLGRVIAYDRPAFGLTPRPLRGEWGALNPYAAASQPELLTGLMDALGVKQAILVGNSAGGTVAVNMALTYPQRVQALVLVDAAIYGSGGSLPAWVTPLLGTPQAERVGTALARSISERGMEILVTAWHDSAKITPEIKANYRKPLQTPNWDGALWEMTRSAGGVAVSTRLAELNLPVLVVTGDDDRIVPTQSSIRLGGEIPGATLVVFPACGHVPQEECPQAWLQTVEPFIVQNK